MAGKRDRDRRQARSKPYRTVLPRILVVTEGKNSEPEYLEGYRKALRNPRVVIVVHGGIGVPRTVVQHAKSLKGESEDQARMERDDNLKYDEVWCAFDIDKFPVDVINDAVQIANASQIQLAISNPCFELWLWLHFRESPGMVGHREIQSRLKKIFPNYDKHVNYSDYQQGYAVAVIRARKLDEEANRSNEPRRNPTTGFWKLTESIRGSEATE